MRVYAPIAAALPVRTLCCAVAVLASLASTAHAQSSARVGLAPDGLPGIERVGAARAGAPGLSLSIGPDYGYTGDVLGQDDSHHSGGLDVGLAYRVASALAVAVHSRPRFDVHAGVGNEDAGFAAHTELRARGGPYLEGDFDLGVEAAVLLPASDSFGAALSGLSPSVAVLLSTDVSARLSLLAQLGFMLDRQVEAIDDARALSAADRVTLGVGEANVLPIGLGASYALKSLDVIGEWTWDLRLGADAPAPLESTMWLRAGVRTALTGSLTLSGLVGANLAARPQVVPGTALQELAPRIWVGVRVATAAAASEVARGQAGELLGLVRDAGGAPVAAARVAVGAAEATTDAEGRFALQGLPPGSAEVIVAADGYAQGRAPIEVSADGISDSPIEIVLAASPVAWTTRVRGPDGEPVADARAVLSRDDQSLEGVTDAEGAVRFEGVAPGRWTLRVDKEGYGAIELEVQFGPGSPAPAPPEIQLEAALPEGQIRGTVRAFDGAPLRATARVEPLGVEVRADANGEFLIDVPPGEYQVVLRAPGYRKQKRAARVEDHGVTVLIVDLRRAK